MKNNEISLHRFVDELAAGLLPLAVSKKTLIINQIDKDLAIGSDEDMLAYVLWNLLNCAVSSTQNECIHIESQCTGEGTMIRLRNTGTYFYRTICHGFRPIQDVAEKLGGSVSIDYAGDASPSVALTLNKKQIKAA